MIKIKKVIIFLCCIAIPLAVGSIAGVATSTGVGSWYMTILKPSFNPPNWIFGPVWTTLYLLMGISLYLIYNSVHPLRKKALIIFSFQLAVNFAWSFVFFMFHNIFGAYIIILIIVFSVAYMIYIFNKISKTAAAIQLPYLAWVSFASVLNLAIWYIN